MSRILLRLAMFVPILMLVTLVLEAYGRILPPTPDALLDICPLPCVLGITPSITQGAEVQNILSLTLPTNNTVTVYNTFGTESYTLETSVGEHYISGLVTLNPSDNVVQIVSLSSQFPLTTLFEKWGAPDCIQITSYDNVPAAGVLDWQRGEYMAQVLFTFAPPKADWTTASVQSLAISAGLPGCGVGMRAWQGFAPVWRYQ